MKLKLLLILPFAAFCQTPFYHTETVSGVSFGIATATFGNETIVSTSFTNIPLMDTPGEVPLFLISGNETTQTHVFSQNDGQASDGFGDDVAFDGDHIAIAAPQHNMMGAVYTYRRNNGSWNFLQKLTEPDTPGVNYFQRVCLHGDYLFVGTFADEADGMPVDTDSGAVYVYHFDGTEWVYQQKLTVEGSRFLGIDIKAEGNYIVAQGMDDSNSTRFFTFELNGSDWEFLTTSPIFPSGQSYELFDGELYLVFQGDATQSVLKMDYANGWNAESILAIPPSDQIFSSIKILGDRMFIGSNGYILSMTRKFPLLYYRKIGEAWTYQDTFYGQGPNDDDDYFGSVLSGHGNHLIIGSPYEGSAVNNGMAYYLDTESLAAPDLDTTAFMIYPNPANDEITIESAAQVESVKIYSVDGSLVLSGDSAQINIGFLSSGFYLVKIEFTHGNPAVSKILKK